jgi:hypothetical protein
MSITTTKHVETAAVEPEIVEQAPVAGEVVVRGQSIPALGAGRPARQAEPGMVAIVERKHGGKWDRCYSYSIGLVTEITSEGIVTGVAFPGTKTVSLRRGQWTNIVVDLGCRVPEPWTVLYHLRDFNCQPARFQNIETAVHALKGAVTHLQKSDAWAADRPRREAQWQRLMESFNPPLHTKRKYRESAGEYATPTARKGA